MSRVVNSYDYSLSTSLPACLPLHICDTIFTVCFVIPLCIFCLSFVIWLHGCFSSPCLLFVSSSENTLLCEHKYVLYKSYVMYMFMMCMNACVYLCTFFCASIYIYNSMWIFFIEICQNKISFLKNNGLYLLFLISMNFYSWFTNFTRKVLWATHKLWSKLETSACFDLKPLLTPVSLQNLLCGLQGLTTHTGTYLKEEMVNFSDSISFPVINLKKLENWGDCCTLRLISICSLRGHVVF